MKGKSASQTSYNEVSSNLIAKISNRILPPFLFLKLKKMKNSFKFTILNLKDRRSYIKIMNSEADEKIKFDVLINTHILEKGLSHKRIRYHFGKQVLQRLSIGLIKLREREMFDTEEYQYAISTLNAYYILHEKNNMDSYIISEIFDEKTYFDIINRNQLGLINDLGGTFILERNSKLDNQSKNFKDLALNRYTVRNFDDSKVDINKIKEAIYISKKTPSACNRQSARVVVIVNESMIKEILEVQGGFRGYDVPSVLIICLADLFAYSSYTDRYMGYVDGGLFTMSLIYSLEYMGLGSCLLNASFDSKKEKKIRGIASIPDNEKFLALIAVGNLSEKTTIAKSYRVSSKNIMRIID